MCWVQRQSLSSDSPFTEQHSGGLIQQLYDSNVESLEVPHVSKL